MSAAVPSTSTMDIELPKRKRKRTRSRKSKGGDAGEQEAQEEEHAEEQTHVGPPAAAAPAEPAVSRAEKTDSDKPAEKVADDNDGDDDDGEDDTGGKKKRKRNRKRSKKGGQAEGEGEGVQAVSTSTSQAPTTTHKSLEEELKSSGVSDPEKDTDVPEGSKRAALSYAYTHHTTRTSWKFQKAKEAWLLRHLLTPAVVADSQPEQSTTQTRTDTISGEEPSPAPPVDNSIPDVYLPLVVNYLSTMQGKSKDRLVDDLKSAVRQARDSPVEAVVKEIPAATATTAAIDAPKSVSFADVADEQNRKDETGVDETAERRARDQVRWKGARAEKVLAWFGVSV